MDERVKSPNKREHRSAVVFGASGLVGGELWRILEKDAYWSSITCVGRRRPPGLARNEKVRSVEADLFLPNLYKKHLNVDTVFICLGTTLKKAGSKAAFKQIDVELPKIIAQESCQSEVRNLVVISAQGIHKNSIFFYNRAKAEMEEKVSAVFPENCCFVRPGLLLGDRRETRVAESLSASLLTRLDSWMEGSILEKYRAIPAKTVASAMNQISQMDKIPSIIENQELFRLGSV